MIRKIVIDLYSFFFRVKTEHKHKYQRWFLRVRRRKTIQRLLREVEENRYRK